MSTKYVVVGSNSFSGADFVDYLLTAGAQVVGISRSPEPNDVFLPYKANKNQGRFQFRQLDLNQNLQEMMATLDDFRPDYVVNFASQSLVAESWAAPEHWYQTNVVATIKFHDQLRKRTYLKKYVHISTPEVYGSCSGLVPENTNYNPSTPYAVSRAACDMSLMTFFKNYNFPVVFTRAANVFGPGQQLYRIVPRAMLFCRLGRKLQLHGGGHSVRSFIHIRDVSVGTEKVASMAQPPNIYHLSTQRQISIRQLVEMICEMTGVQFKDAVEVTNDRPGKDQAYLLDSAKAHTELGWADQISLEDGLRQTLNWVDQNLDILKQQTFDYVHRA